MSRPLWFVNLIKKIYPGRDIFAKSSNAPILNQLIDRTFFSGDALWYLPANRSLKVNESIEMPRDYVMPSSVIEHFIQEASVHWIMDTCICRDANHCRDYPSELGCLFMGRAAADINPKLGRLVNEEEALRHVQVCREAGLVHLIGRNKLDTQWLGVGPGTELLTVCNCCPCCCLWRMLPHLHADIREKVQPMPGVEVMISEECIGCEVCRDEVCFVNAIEMRDGIASINGNCVGCGRCVELCPVGAIELKVTDDRFIHETIDVISSLIQLD